MLEFIKKYKNKILITIGIVCTIALLFLVYNLENSSTVIATNHNEAQSANEDLNSEDIDINTDCEENKEDSISRNEFTNDETADTNSDLIESTDNVDSNVAIKPSTNSNTTTQSSDMVNENKVVSNEKSEVIQSEKPVKKEEIVEASKSYSSFLINCSTVYNNIDKLKDGKESSLGNNGTIFSGKVEFTEGETVLDVLKRIGSNNGISIANNGGYITGINGLNQKDCGAQSGWMYSVNGTFPSKSVDKYVLSNGDKVKFLYTCSLGKDLN